MQILKSSAGLSACFSPKELSSLIAFNFLGKMFNAEHLKDEAYDSQAVSKHIAKLAKESADSRSDYEYFTAVLDLYHAFSKDCKFAFNLKSSFNPTKNSIKNLEDLKEFNDDPPDIIVKTKEGDYAFEIKRYRGNLNFKDLYSFIKDKIILYYFLKLKFNFLILLQPQKGSGIDLSVFKKIHEHLIKEKNQPGQIWFSFNHDNKEIIKVRVLPKLNMSKRPYKNENDQFTDLFSAEV